MEAESAVTIALLGALLLVGFMAAVQVDIRSQCTVAEKGEKVQLNG